MYSTEKIIEIHCFLLTKAGFSRKNLLFAVQTNSMYCKSMIDCIELIINMDNAFSQLLFEYRRIHITSRNFVTPTILQLNRIKNTYISQAVHENIQA